MILFFMFIPFVILMTAVVLIWYLPGKQSKNDVVVHFFKKRTPIKPHLQKKEVALQVPCTSKEAENAALFEILNNRVLADKLYLNPTIERGDLCKVIGVEKNRFAQIIRQNTGTHLIGYINNLRLDYAVQLMKEHPQYVISKISMHSGLTNIRTFYRLFYNRFGMTPLAYRKSLQSKEDV